MPVGWGNISSLLYRTALGITLPTLSNRIRKTISESEKQEMTIIVIVLSIDKTANVVTSDACRGIILSSVLYCRRSNALGRNCKAAFLAVEIVGPGCHAVDQPPCRKIHHSTVRFKCGKMCVIAEMT